MTLSTPRFEYSRSMLEAQAKKLLQTSMPYGFLPRYAMKANNHPEIIKLFAEAGLHFDASSSYEAMELLEQGIAGEKISLSSQQPAHNLDELLAAGVRYVATSLRQLELYANSTNRSDTVGLRVNPGGGSGYNNRMTTGGVNSSFGLWHEYINEALQFASQAGIKIDCLHIHVGSGSDPHKWADMMESSLALVDKMPDVTSLDIGGGFKVHYYGDQQEADVPAILAVLNTQLVDYAAKTGRKLQLEIEPGRWLVAHAGTLIAEVVDIVDTGVDGHNFLRLNTGMNDFIRPSMYGAQHKIDVLSEASEQMYYVVVGHNCETGDIFTTAPGDPEGIEPRRLNKAAIGDKVAIYDTGAYSAIFATHGYNSYPGAVEVFVD